MALSAQDKSSSNTNLDKYKLIDLAAGHPHTLHIFYVLARDSADFISQMIAATRATDVVQQLLLASFHQLTESQRRILLTIALFDGNATLDAVSKVGNASHKLVVRCLFVLCAEILADDLATHICFCT